MQLDICLMLTCLGLHFNLDHDNALQLREELSCSPTLVLFKPHSTLHLHPTLYQISLSPFPSPCLHNMHEIFQHGQKLMEDSNKPVMKISKMKGSWKSCSRLRCLPGLASSWWRFQSEHEFKGLVSFKSQRSECSSQWQKVGCIQQALLVQSP